MRRVAAHIGGLTGVWVLLWGSLSVANVATGLLVSGALLVVFPLEHRRRDTPVVVRPIAAVRLVAYFLVQLIASNLTMTWQIVRPRPSLRTGIVACPMHTRSPGLITLITDIIALSPGMVTVDVITPRSSLPSTVFVHVLRLTDPSTTRRQVARLERLVIGAFGVASEVEACRVQTTVPPAPAPGEPT